MNTEGIRTQGCKLCIHQEIEAYERAYFDKKLTVDEIVKELGVTNYTFYKHIRDHVKPETGMTLSKGSLILADQVIDKQGKVIKIIETLEKQIDKITLILDGEIDVNMIKAFTLLIGENRRNIKILAELQGEFRINEPKTVTNNYNIEYTQVVDVVMQYACEKCKPIFARELRPVLKIIKHEN